jgi:hypothetical protein
MVKSDEPPARRQAATALGQIGDARAVAPLLDAAAGAVDRFVEHAIIYSLIQLKDSKAMIAALKRRQPRIRKAALIALDQMDGSPLAQHHAAPFLSDRDAELRRAALWVISHHADWAGAALSFLRGRLRAPKFEANEAEPVRETLLAFAAVQQVQNLVAESLDNRALGANRQLFLLETIERSPLKQLPEIWARSLARRLKDPGAQVRARGRLR